MNTPARKKWNDRYHDTAPHAPEPARVLLEFRHLLPSRGEALDLACGRGANAQLLARAGLITKAWDISDVAIQQLREQVALEALPLTAQVRDVVAEPPGPGSFDIIVVSRFLERALCPALTAALRPGGLLFYQTFVRDKVNTIGPGSPDYLLESGELLRLFPGLLVRAYRDEGSLGDVEHGWRNEAYLVAQRPV